MTRRGRLLYLSPDGLLEPLGYSQVARVVLALARRGFRYDVASLEKPRDLARAEGRERLRAELARAGVEWFVEPYDASGGGRAAASNLGRLTRVALRRTASGAYALLHARSYVAAAAARAARALRGVPYLFDARGYWIDEKLEEGRWFTNPGALRVGRLLEGRLYRGAAGVVTLTELQAGDVARGRFGRVEQRPVVAIPTCADYDEFVLGARPRPSVPDGVLAELEGRLVLGFVGSLNRSYLVEESARLARLILERRPDACVLALSGQTAEYRTLFERHGIPPGRSLVTPVEHAAMPEWVSLLDWGVLLLASPFAKRGSMPTKLAEFFASGVRPLHYGCNEEVAEWVGRAGSGLVLSGVTEAALVAAADHVAGASRDAAPLAAARAATEGHFSLASGVERYARLLRRLGVEGDGDQPASP